MNVIFDNAVIGAGPAGMMAAAVAACAGGKVVLIDRNPQLGRKLLATGNGRCNLTNRCITVDRYHGADPSFIGSILRRFGQRETTTFFESLGLMLKEEDNGRIFPRTNQASSVVEALRHELVDQGVSLRLGVQVTGIEPSGPWRIALSEGEPVEAFGVVVATGGWAANQFGSTGDGLHWARKLGHTVTPMRPALAPIETLEDWPSEAQGTRVEARIRAVSDGETIGDTTGDVLFTSYGVSGTAVMALARSVAIRLDSGEVTLRVDLFPEMLESELLEWLMGYLLTCERRSVAESLVGVLPSGLIGVVARLAGVGLQDTANMVSLPPLVKSMKDMKLTASKVRPFREAQVTSGGIPADEVVPSTLESRIVPGLHFAGEILDVDGDSGGFNLQWAWSSGYVAGISL